MKYTAVLLILSLVACGRSTPIIQERFDPAAYVVQTGDTVYSIAWRYSQDHRDVIAWNNLSKPYTIYPGQKLKVRGNPIKRSSVQTASVQSTPATNSGSSAVKVQPLKKPRTATATAPTPAKPAVKPKPAPVSIKVNSPNTWVWPVKGNILSHFSASAIDRQGIDIKGKKGAKVVASRGGTVVYSGSGMRTYGRLVIIKHNERFLSAYAYNSKLLVKENDTVKPGQAIALMGVSNQGVAKLHFEIRNNGKPVNPLKYLPKR